MFRNVIKCLTGTRNGNIVDISENSDMCLYCKRTEPANGHCKCILAKIFRDGDQSVRDHESSITKSTEESTASGHMQAFALCVSVIY